MIVLLVCDGLDLVGLSADVQINSFNIKISLLFQVADKSKSLK